MSSNFIDAINESNASSPATDGAVPFELLDMTTRGEDRRAVLRFGFPHKQYVAPYQGGCLPSRASFKEVNCRDVSEHGFSFLTTSPPDFDLLVVALGVAPDLTYMTARVENRICISEGVSPMYRIGCRFMGRLK